jgi:hypothetical protein
LFSTIQNQNQNQNQALQNEGKQEVRLTTQTPRSLGKYEHHYAFKHLEVIDRMEGFVNFSSFQRLFLILGFPVFSDAFFVLSCQ